LKNKRDKGSRIERKKERKREREREREASSYSDIQWRAEIVDGDVKLLVPSGIQVAVDGLGFMEHLVAQLELDVRIAGS